MGVVGRDVVSGEDVAGTDDVGEQLDDLGHDLPPLVPDVTLNRRRVGGAHAGSRLWGRIYGMNWVDYVLLVIVALSGIHGLRLGAAMQVLTFGGLLLGLVLGALLAPSVAKVAHGRSAQTLIALIVLIGVATIVGGMGRLLGARSGRLLHRLRLGPVDSVFGVAVAVVVALVVTWVVAILLQGSQYSVARPVAAAVADRAGPRRRASAHPHRLRGDGAVPRPERLPRRLHRAPPSDRGPVTCPPTHRRAPRCCGPRGRPCRWRGRDAGSSRKGRASWSHRGSSSPTRTSWRGSPAPFVIDSTGRHATSVALFDPRLDIAVLRVHALTDAALPVDSSVVARGTTGVVLGYPGGGPLTPRKAGVAAAFQAVGLDIYGSSQTTREIYQLDALVQPGNSGGPLVASGDPGVADGTVIGVVFARSTSNSNVGYALAMPAVSADVAHARARTQTVGTGSCVS